MTKKKGKFWKRTINKKGGSFAVSVPPEIIEHLRLCEGDQMVFLLDPDKEYLIIGTDKIFDIKAKGRINGHEVDLEFLRFPPSLPPRNDAKKESDS